MIQQKRSGAIKQPSEQATGSNQTMDDRQFLNAFEHSTLPFDEWTHRAHLRVAYLYASQFDLPTATDKMRAGIKAYNKATNTPEELERGYHETITVAFMQLVTAALQQSGPFPNSEAFCDTCAVSLNKPVLLKYYSKDRIISMKAKQTFVEPDLQPLPVIN
jgi:hypothetical protein|tara:strand:+ start:90406 stop:90888 length:483 start_codon:yes stop_codon:yes gene_type:complete